MSGQVRGGTRVREDKSYHMAVIQATEFEYDSTVAMALQSNFIYLFYIHV